MTDKPQRKNDVSMVKLFVQIFTFGALVFAYNSCENSPKFRHSNSTQSSTNTKLEDSARLMPPILKAQATSTILEP